jgi:HK97 family phage major capsid protein
MSMTLRSSGLTYNDMQRLIQDAIEESISSDPYCWVWVQDMTDTVAIYSLGGDTFEVPYTIDAGNVVKLGEPVPVVQVTTYEPITESKGASKLESRSGGRVDMRALAMMLGSRDPQESRAPARFNPEPPTVAIKSEPLTYERHSRHSYFADLLTSNNNPPAEQRLNRHRDEMRVIAEERNQRALRGLRSGEFEYRVEPNVTDGTGGYFTIPLWMNQLFATAVRPRRVVAGLIPRFVLPPGVSSINLPIIGTGTRTQHVNPDGPVPSADITDTAGSSNVVTIAGIADVAVQMVEQSPQGAHLDWALLKDMAEDYDRDLETALLTGRGSSFNELLGVLNADTAVTYSSASPTGSAMWAYFGQAAGQLGDARDLPPECWVMRTARWSWLQTSEDTASRPFGIPSPFFLGSDDATPDPVGGLIGWPVFLSDAIKATQGTGANQDFILCMRPSDLILLEGAPQTSVMRDVLSGSLGARISLHANVAAITNRYPASIYSIQGTGMTVASGF